eukprot:CAMPEP_0198236796 /NCGR_PEP_ID=MMETSP1446-20131203/2687_1 /TAXON_ID=1461542 ORGANISM="Unidentified sp, Strain CCMP2111" /NCGR_SAMPLE_ID=MMETSP1446 /ASSEMBLY_ACC=CAM_ASM_001112 /LENGTH=132 /DNA_ID=CAMNT_0043918735 /DNA_START=763 /DNA_END=1157 /DNA_ORIENTATION=-
MTRAPSRAPVAIPPGRWRYYGASSAPYALVPHRSSPRGTPAPRLPVCYSLRTDHTTPELATAPPAAAITTTRMSPCPSSNPKAANDGCTVLREVLPQLAAKVRRFVLVALAGEVPPQAAAPHAHARPPRVCQ